MKKKNVYALISSLIILLAFSGCGGDDDSQGEACAGKGYTEKICAVTGNNTVDGYDWNGTEMTNHTTGPSREENSWGVGFRNTSSVSLDICTDGSGSEWDGNDSVSEGIPENSPGFFVAETITNEYPNGPPCIYYRLHEE